MSGTDRTNADGAFSFTGLQASDYLVEVLSGDEVVASASVTLAEGAMQVSGINVAQSESGPGWWGHLPRVAPAGQHRHLLSKHLLHVH